MSLDQAWWIQAEPLLGRRSRTCPGAAACIAPIGFEDARRLVADATVVSRSAPALVLDALAQVLVALGRLAVEHPEIAAVDINPVVVTDNHAVALDALVVVGGGEP